MLNIYCVTHQKVDLHSTGITTLQVGGAEEVFADLSDRSGDSICNLNHRFSELTGHYFIWKNRPSSAVGFCHYRRFLVPDSFENWLDLSADGTCDSPKSGAFATYDSGFRVSTTALCEKLSSTNYLEELVGELETCDVLMPKSNKIQSGSFLNQYGLAHPLHPLLQLLANLCEQNQSMGRRAVNFFSNHDVAYWNNLYVMRWQEFDEFCEFQFKLLFQINEQIKDIDTTYQNRVCAFLSERLLNFWVWHRSMKVKELNWCITEDIRKDAEPHHPGIGVGPR